MRVKIDVTEKDIKAGKRKMCYSCPVALAANRAFSKAGLFHYATSRVSVDNGVEILHRGHKGRRVDYYFKLPLKVWQFIGRFDVGKSVKPFSFTVTN